LSHGPDTARLKMDELDLKAAREFASLKRPWHSLEAWNDLPGGGLWFRLQVEVVQVVEGLK